MANCPMPIPRRLQKAVVRQIRDPACETFSRARKANAPESTGPQPVR
jgi:hypothetical protein